MGLKRSLSIEFHNRKGRGLRSIGEMTTSMAVGKKNAPSVKKRRLPGSSAKGQNADGDGVKVSRRTAGRIKNSQLWNKYTESQSPSCIKPQLVCFILF